MKAEFWVSMNDSFMSDWGPARGLINRLVIGCESMREAEIVRINAEDRSEMSDVLIHSIEPIYDQRVYFVSYHDTDDYKTWKRTDRPFYREEDNDKNEIS